MAGLQSRKLFVNLGASQCRRRLKGFGNGVRKVETAGNNKSVIIHTATGKHLRQLQAEFADVGYAENEAGLRGSAAGQRTVVVVDESAEASPQRMQDQETGDG